jgi:hypothetical protein
MTAECQSSCGSVNYSFIPDASQSCRASAACYRFGERADVAGA